MSIGQHSLSMRCETIDSPGRNLLTIDNRIYGNAYKIPYGHSNPDITASFLLSSNMQEKIFFDSWMEFVVGVDNQKTDDLGTKLPNYNIQYFKSKITKIA